MKKKKKNQSVRVSASLTLSTRLLAWVGATQMRRCSLNKLWEWLILYPIIKEDRQPVSESRRRGWNEKQTLVYFWCLLFALPVTVLTPPTGLSALLPVRRGACLPWFSVRPGVWICPLLCLSVLVSAPPSICLPWKSIYLRAHPPVCLAWREYRRVLEAKGTHVSLNTKVQPSSYDMFLDYMSLFPRPYCLSVLLLLLPPSLCAFPFLFLP